MAFAATAGLTWRFCDPASGLHILDYPNERSLHVHPIPRSGGVAVLGGLALGAVLAGLAYPQGEKLGMVLAIGIPVVVVSFMDDRWGVHPGARILIHVLVAFMLIGSGYSPDSIELPGLSWQVSLLTESLLVLWIVWMINLFNFMDGMDGFAAGMAVIGFTTFAILGEQAGDPVFATACLLVVAAAGGFLLFNFPPARIFLGDSGSSALGFLAAAFALWASQEDLFPLWISILVFSPFIVDATVTLIRRLLRGEKVWQAHKTHYYQRLVRLGWGHRRTVLVEYLLMLSCNLSALLAVHLPTATQIGLLITWLLVYALLMIRVGRLEQRFPGKMPS